MDLYEYQARDLFEKHNVPVLQGAVATTPEQARDAAAKLRALAFAAMENRVSSNCDEQLNGEFAAYSLISGYGF